MYVPDTHLIFAEILTILRKDHVRSMKEGTHRVEVKLDAIRGDIKVSTASTSADHHDVLTSCQHLGMEMRSEGEFSPDTLH